jgi:hypothetical protein
MKFWVRSLVLAVALSGVCNIASAQIAASQLTAQIYLIRGLFGIFSLGMDQIATKLRDQGYDPKIIGWEQWGVAVNDILANYRGPESSQIILIGHSLGSDSAIQIAESMGSQNISIDLVVTFDITQPLRVPDNVDRFINFYQDNGVGRRAIASPGFKGQLSNIDLSADRSVDHLNIDESARLQQIVVNKIFEVTFQQAQEVPKRRRTITR